nr:MAG TPA: hypothetical protein [Caudoviricetes sp.]
MLCGISALVILRVLDANMSPFATATAVRSFRRPPTGSPTRAPTSRHSSRKLRGCGGSCPGGSRWRSGCRKNRAGIMWQSGTKK